MRGSRPSRVGDAGFTLIELLVTMTLLALLSIGLVGGIRYGTRIWQASETAAGQDRRILSAQTTLRDILEQAYPMYTASTDTDAHVEFDGRADGFTVLAPDTNNPGALRRVTVAGARNSDEVMLVSSEAAELATGPARPAKQRVLLNGIATVDFAYYGKTDPNLPASWQATWLGQPQPPALVRVRVGFADRSARACSELIVAPRITADVKCTFDMLSKGCLGR